ncbi:hypothetical protein AU193_17340 [Mycobacterium sp. GA-1285]|uniref:hypothetical protein n=1 Tax=Mycobacterium sp. GA-1285 TaxID=1772282 RepID=UPI0007466D6A|nr:hypothetical protein [Mycobacterium sp. GA-1285]KUI20292.1 hypothetical protein AU193_17340 [Mycobacterium sp. GA-1285]
MIATTRPAHDETVRLRPGDLPVRPRPQITRADAVTTRLRAVRPATKPPSKATGAFDGKTVQPRAIDLPVVGKVANTVRQRYLDLSTVKKPPTRWDVARLLLVMLLASMPILGISVDVFGLVPQNVTSVVLIALCAVLGALIAFAPHRIDMIVGRGLIAGMVACVVYDAARLFAVHVLDLMGDFIPVMGSFVTGEPNTAGSAAVGYVWRYIGDGGGLGVAFFVVAFALGIDRWRNVYAVLASVAFAVFPTWAGLMATVALAPRGEEMMFPLNIATVTITLVGHLIFGLVLGLAFLKAPRGRERSEWPWPPLFESAPARRVVRAYKRFTNRP